MEMLFVFEELLRTMWRDLGFDNEGIESGDLLGLFITDVREQLKQRQQRQSQVDG
ncbi:MAG TPA: hypothetical protein VFI90_10545 [Rubrobacter sp.]|nr:hypothetical protein [Rubrobacter sp.]